MEKTKVLDAIKKAKEASKDRKFLQSIDLILNLKELDITKPDNKVAECVILPHGSSKQVKVGAFVGGELKAEAEKLCDATVFDKDLPNWTDVRKIRKLARSCTFFIAQSTVMPIIAKQFGKYLAPIGKMPDPKAGQIVLPNTNLKPVVDKFKNSIRLFTKKSPVIQASIGNVKMSDDDVAENILFVVDAVLRKLPQGKNNLKEVLVKTTMGKPVKIE